MKISIIITLMNDRDVIKTVDSILCQTLLPHEVIVADAGNDEWLYKRLKEYDGIVKAYKIYGSIVASRHETIPLVGGDVIVFIDSDEVAPKEWLKLLTDPIQNGEADFVGGRTIPFEGPKNKIEQYVYDKAEWSYKHLKSKDVTHIAMGNSAWKKEIFDVIGNFDKNLIWGAEDLDINLRAAKHGFKGVFLQDAWVWHDRGLNTLKKFIKKTYKFNIGSTIVYKKHGVFDERKGNAIKTSLNVLDLFTLVLKAIAYLRGVHLWRKLYKKHGLIEKGVM